MALEVGRREARVGVDQVQAEMRDARAVRGRDLGRADVHAAEDLPRVGADDLHVAEGVGQGQGELRLAGRGRAGDDEERWERLRQDDRAARTARRAPR